jgi:hypothetical protein
LVIAAQASSHSWSHYLPGRSEQCYLLEEVLTEEAREAALGVGSLVLLVVVLLLLVLLLLLAACENGVGEVLCVELSDHVIEVTLCLSRCRLSIATLALLLILRHPERNVVR